MKLQNSHYLLFLAFIILWGCDPGVNTFHDLASESRETRPVGPSDALVEADVRQTLNDAGVSMENLQLDWVQQKSYPLYIKDKNIVVVPVAGKEDFILFYREKGRIGYKYLHPYSTAGAATPFGERAFRVVVNNGDLQGISEEIQGIDTRLKKLTIRSCEWPPLRCPGETTIWDWIGNVWSNFKNWVSSMVAFNSSGSGGYSGTTSTYFTSNGANSSGYSSTYTGIPFGEIGVHYSGGGSGVYDQDGEIFALNVVQALNILPNLGGQHPEYGQWLEDNPQKAGEIWMFLNGSNNYSSASKKAAIKYIELMKNDAGFRSASISLTDPEFFNSPEGFLATAVLYEAYKSEVGNNPVNPYQWQLAMEVFREELVPLGLTFIPVVGDLIGSYNDFQSGDYFMGCAGLILAVVPSNELFKVIDDAPTIAKGWKAVKKVFVLWNKLFTTTGGQKVLNKLPQSWKDLPGSKLQKDNSLKWVQPGGGHHFRLSDRKLNPQYPNEEVPYGKFFKNGSWRDINGNAVIEQSNAAHIAIDDLTDEFLNWFFN